MFGLLIGGLILGGAAIGSAIKNAEAKSKPYRYTDDGTPVYLDYECNEWINGEKVIATYDYKNQKLVYAGEKSKKVYFDPQNAQAERLRKTIDEPNLQRAKRYGYTVYNRWYPEFKEVLSTEISTGKIIVEVHHDEKTGVYTKYYYKGGYVACINNGCFYGRKKGDSGIVISKEEYDKLYNNSRSTYIKTFDW